MKKILLAMLLFGAIVFNSQAQGNPCGCVPTTTQETYIYGPCNFDSYIIVVVDVVVVVAATTTTAYTITEPD